MFYQNLQHDSDWKMWMLYWGSSMDSGDIITEDFSLSTSGPSASPKCLSLVKVITANIPVNRMWRQLDREALPLMGDVEGTSFCSLSIVIHSGGRCPNILWSKVLDVILSHVVLLIPRAIPLYVGCLNPFS